MKFIPILFSTPMVQAILEDRKTMTRRIIKPQPIDSIETDGNIYEGKYRGYVKVDCHPNWSDQFVYEFSKFQKGDVLWVREMFIKNCFSQYYFKVDIRPDGSTYEMKDPLLKWKPSLFMPKEACRIFLEIIDVRVEQLHDITEVDAVAEGVQSAECSKEMAGTCPSSLCATNGCAGIGIFFRYPVDFDGEPCYSATESFETLWQSINGAESWNTNPFVWVISFKKIERPDNF